VKVFPRKIKHKFHAKPTTVDDIRFDSKKEAKYYGNLKLLQKSGELLFFLRQVPFHLPGGVIYRLDFMEFWANEDILFREIKGFETKEWKIKKRLVESLYPITIEVIK